MNLNDRYRNHSCLAHPQVLSGSCNPKNAIPFVTYRFNRLAAVLRGKHQSMWHAAPLQTHGLPGPRAATHGGSRRQEDGLSMASCHAQGTARLTRICLCQYISGVTCSQVIF